MAEPRRPPEAIPFAMLLLRILLLGSAIAAAPDRPPPGAAEGTLVQTQLPAFAAREAAAKARVDGATRWFAGAAELGEAFPTEVGAPLSDPAYLAGRLAAVQQAAVSRAAERVGDTPEGLGAADAARFTKARAAACDAEDTADALLRRFYTGIQAGVASAPGLAEGPVAAQAEKLRVARIGADAPGADEATAGAAAQSGADEAMLRRYQAAALRRWTVPGDITLDELVRADLEHGDSPSPALVDRLDRVGPLLGSTLAEDAARVVQRARRTGLEAEIAALQAALASIDPAEPWGVAETPETLSARLANAQEPAAPAAPAGDPALATLIAERDALAVRLQAERMAAGKALQARLAAATQVAPTSAEVESARTRAAEASQAATQSGGTQSDAAARQETARLAGATADLLAESKSRHEASVARLVDLRAAADAAAAKLAGAAALPPLDAGRQAAFDAAFVDYRAVVDALRAELATLDGSSPSRPDGNLDATFAGASAEVAAELASAQEALAAAVAGADAAASQDTAAALVLLQEAKQGRRQARARASRAARAVVRQRFLPELAQEVSEVPLTFRSWGAQLGGVTTRARSVLTNLDLLASAAGWLAWGALLVGGWWLARRRGPDFLSAWVRRAERAEGPGRPTFSATLSAWWVEGDVRALAERARPAVALVPDLGLALVLWWGLEARLSIVSALAIVWCGWVAYRLAPEVVGLAFVTADEAHPGLRRVTTADRARLVWTSRIAAGWLLLRAVLLEVTGGVLDADRMSELVSTVFAVAALALSAVVLARWAPVLRETALERDEGGSLPAWLRVERRSRFAVVGAALGHLVFLVGDALRAVGRRVVEGQSSLAWIAALLARRDLRGAKAPALSAPDAATLRALEQAEPLYVARPDVVDRGLALAARWTQERARGLVAVTSDTGCARGEVLRDLAAALARDGEVSTLPAIGEQYTAQEAWRWLVDATGAVLPAGELTQGAVVEALERLPPRRFVLDGLHTTFVRAVGGFDGLNAILGALHHTCDHHFWVVGIHRNAWAYLSKLPNAVNLSVFSECIDMGRLPHGDLESWLVAATANAGYSLDFAHLAPDGGGRVVAERARVAYWRILGEASAGNPDAARALFLDSLRLHEEGRLAVVLFDEPARDLAGQLTDAEMFVLTALMVHEQLDATDLARALNLSDSAVRGACRRLEGLRAVEVGPSERYLVRASWRPACERVLRDRHFLHLE